MALEGTAVRQGNLVSIHAHREEPRLLRHTPLRTIKHPERAHSAALALRGCMQDQGGCRAFQALIALRRHTRTGPKVGGTASVTRVRIRRDTAVCVRSARLIRRLTRAAVASLVMTMMMMTTKMDMGIAGMLEALWRMSALLALRRPLLDSLESSTRITQAPVVVQLRKVLRLALLSVVR
jgi:hypothetical protein